MVLWPKDWLGLKLLPSLIPWPVWSWAKHLTLLCFNPPSGEGEQRTPALPPGTAGFIDDGKALWSYGDMGTQGCRKMGQSGNGRLSFTSEGQQYLI